MAMNIFSNTSAQQIIEKVPVFLLYDKIDASSMGFYAFHSKFSRLFRVDSGDEPILATPFTTFRYFPDDCKFIPYRGKIMVVGGDQFCDYITRTLYDILLKNRMNGEGVCQSDISEEEIIRIVKEEDNPSEMLPSLMEHPIFEVTGISGPSDRTKTFDFQKFIDNHEQPQLGYADFDRDTDYWNSCPGLHMARVHGHLLSSQERVLSLVQCIDYRGLEIQPEVLFNGCWHPVSLPVQLYVFVSAVVDDCILIGSCIDQDQPSFGVIPPDFSEWFPLKNIECPPNFILGCSGQPGIVVRDHGSWDDTIVVWNDKRTHCIRGLHLGHQQHFNVDFVNEKIVIPDFTDADSVYRLADACNLYDAQLIGMGDGTLAMIYRGQERDSVIDDQGKDQDVTDYWYVTFKLIYDNSGYPARVPYPGIPVKTRIISSRKCYAPLSPTLVAAFAMDVCFPDEVEENLSESSINQARFGMHAVLQ